MSDLLHRAQKVKTLTSDLSVPKWERLQQGLELFSGLQVTGIDEDVWESFEAALVPVNSLFDGYDLGPNDDLQRMSEEDAQRGLDSLRAAAGTAIEGELDRIVADLAEAGRKLPVEAIREAREHRDLMVPRLIRVLREATVAARDGHLPEGNAHFFALFLLSEFQAAEALAAILEVISLPGELPFDLFGDAVTSTISRVLAQFAGDTPEILDTLIADRGLNEYVRWEAAQSYVHLVRDRRLPRDEAVRRLQKHLRQAIDQEDVSVISLLVCELTGLSPREAIDDITEAFDRGLVDPYTIDKKSVEQSIAEGDVAVHKALARCAPTGIADTIEELQRWAAFREVPVKPPVAPSAPPPHFFPAPRVSAPVTTPAAAQATRRRVGRNEPCPCGSGKKFKKCCWSRA